MRARIAMLALLAVAAAGDGAARADAIKSKRMHFAERGDQLVVSTTFTDVLDSLAYDRLSNGFTTTVVARIYIFRKGVEEPVSAFMTSFRLVYDLWDQEYVVRIDGPLGRQTRHFARQSDALIALTTLDRVPVAPLSDIPRGPHHYLAMVVELNPVSRELQAEMRRWLTRPAGSASIDRGSSFFGSFVSVFVNPRLPEADRILRVRSQPFYRVAE